MIKHTKTKILLEGHNDSKGSKEYCRMLSKKQALEVKEYIMVSDIDESRIVSIVRLFYYSIVKLLWNLFIINHLFTSETLVFSYLKTLA